MAERGRPRGFDRAHALSKAMEVFWERGFEGATIKALTAAMQINSPSLYAAFGSKERLFREAVELYDELEGSATERALRDESTARAAVEAMLRVNAQAYTDPETPRGCLIVLGAATWTPENESVREYLAGYRHGGNAALLARLKRALSDGDLPAGTDVVALADFYTTILQGLSIQARDGASESALQRIADSAMAAWDGLILVPDAR